MTRIVLVGGGKRLGKSVMTREVTEAARELGYNIIEAGPGVTGRIADTVILGEIPTSPFADMPEKMVATEDPFTPTNRKARRAARSKRR